MTATERNHLQPALRRALGRPPTQHTTQVQGCPISWLSWGEPSAQPVIFIHGGAANSWWWSFTAPLLDDYHVVALDLSGHGDSGRRPSYSFHAWTDEVLGVAEQLSGGFSPVVVGHSMGGIVATLLASQRRLTLSGLVVVDSPLSKQKRHFADDNQILGQPRRYPTAEEAVARFRLLPMQQVASDQLLSHLGRRSVMQEPVGGGWTWKFDARVFSEHPSDRPTELWSLLRARDCPAAVVVGSDSQVVSQEDRHCLGGGAPQASNGLPLVYRSIENGGHHLMFDRPLELMEAVRTLLDGWCGLRPAAVEARR